jgi:hypothetical protein
MSDKAVRIGGLTLFIYYEQDEIRHIIPPAIWELQVKRVPEGVIFELEYEDWGFDCHNEINDILLQKGWGSTTFECELSVRQREEQNKLPCVFRESGFVF